MKLFALPSLGMTRACHIPSLVENEDDDERTRVFHSAAKQDATAYAL